MLKLGIIENKGNKYCRQLWVKTEIVTADFNLGNADFSKSTANNNQSNAENSITLDELKRVIAENSNSEALISAIANAENSYILIKLLLSYTKEDKKESIIGDKPPKPKKVVGSRFENWVKTQDIEKVKSEWIDWALNNSSLHETEITRQLENFSDYWIATTGSKATKADWLATWRTWIRNNYNKGASKGNNRTNKTKQDILDWVAGR